MWRTAPEASVACNAAAPTSGKPRGQQHSPGSHVGLVVPGEGQVCLKGARQREPQAPGAQTEPASAGRQRARPALLCNKQCGQNRRRGPRVRASLLPLLPLPPPLLLPLICCCRCFPAFNSARPAVPPPASAPAGPPGTSRRCRDPGALPWPGPPRPGPCSRPSGGSGAGMINGEPGWATCCSGVLRALLPGAAASQPWQLTGGTWVGCVSPLPIMPRITQAAHPHLQRAAGLAL